VDGCVVAQPEIRLDMVFENDSKLLGLTVRPKQCSPGDVVMLRFYWKDLPPYDTISGTGCFVHCTKGMNRVFQGDYRFEAGKAVYERIIQVPAGIEPGNYSIKCGLFDLQSGTRSKVKTRLSKVRSAVTLPVEIDVRE
jgi:hypothetical protein